MLKELWGKFAYYTFLGMLIIVGLLFGTLNVRAADDLGIYAAFNGYNEVSGCTSNGKFNYDTIGPNVQGGIYWSQGNVNTAITGKAKNIFIAFKHDLEAQKTYDLTINFYSNDLTNKLKSNNILIVDGDNCGDMYGNHISMISFKNTATSSSNTNKVVIRVYSPTLISNWGIYLNGGNNTITSVSNFGIKSATLQVVDTTGTSDIINNQNNNTNTMIDNNNENTTNIINNQNENTQQQIESQNVCKKYTTTNAKNVGYLDSNGLIAGGGGNRVSDYISINKDSTITLIKQVNATFAISFYDKNYSFIENKYNNNFNVNSNIPIPLNAKYLRYGSYIGYDIEYSICSNGNQAINDSLNSLNDTMSNDDIDDPTGFIDDMQDMLPTNGTITQLIALPITLYQKILSNLNGFCSSMNLGNLYGTNLIMPCIEISSYLGSTLWNTIDIIISGVFVLTIARKMIKAFNNFTSMKEGDVIND